MENLEILIQNIEQWAVERNLIEGSTPQKQMFKLMEEFGELCGGIAKNKPEVIKDSIGDCFVVLIILNKQTNNKKPLVFDYISEIVAPDLYLHLTVRSLARIAKSPEFWANDLISDLNGYAKHYGFTSKECLEHAYNQIKDRKGRMIDGVWVKQEDLENEKE